MQLSSSTTIRYIHAFMRDELVNISVFITGPFSRQITTRSQYIHSLQSTYGLSTAIDTLLYPYLPMAVLLLMLCVPNIALKVPVIISKDRFSVVLWLSRSVSFCSWSHPLQNVTVDYTYPLLLSKELHCY